MIINPEIYNYIDQIIKILNNKPLAARHVSQDLSSLTIPNFQLNPHAYIAHWAKKKTFLQIIINSNNPRFTLKKDGMYRRTKMDLLTYCKYHKIPIIELFNQYIIKYI